MFGPNAFNHHILSPHIIRTSRYVKKIYVVSTVPTHSLQSPVVTGENVLECGVSEFCLSDLQLKYEPWLSHNTLWQNPTPSPLWWNKDFALLHT